MRTISKDKLKKIIQEELEKELVDEGLLDTFKELGSDAKKWYQDAAKRGTVKAGDRGTASDGDMDAKPGSDTAKMFKNLNRGWSPTSATAGKKAAPEPRETSADSAGTAVSRSSSKDKSPPEEKSKSEISSGDLLAALNQLENVGNFSPKRFIATLKKYKKSSIGGLNAYVDTANLGKSGQYGASLSNSDKQVLSRLNKSFKGQALTPIAKAFDNAIDYIKNLYGKAGAGARLKEAKRRPYLTEGAKNILMICAESITENPRTSLEESFDKRRAGIQARLMKKWNYNF